MFEKPRNQIYEVFYLKGLHKKCDISRYTRILFL